MEIKRRLVFAAAGISLLAVTASAVAMGHWLSVRPGEFDPLKTRLVQATWVNGIGCPTDAGTAAFVVYLPVAYHCLWSLGFQDTDTRVLAHSLLGCAFYGAMATKLLALPVQSYGATQASSFAGAVGLHVARETGVTPIARVQHPGSAIVRRSLVAAGALYTVSESGILASDLGTLATRGYAAFD